jgi:ATP-dependent DNA ligase
MHSRWRSSCVRDGWYCLFRADPNWETDHGVFMYAFDLIELDGEDMRREPLELRKVTLNVLLGRRAAPGIRFNEHIEEDGPIVFKHACRLGLEGIVSKRKDSRYISGRCPQRPGSEAGG